LKKQPVHDLSIELQGQVAHDGHLFANDQWRFVESIQTTCLGSIIENLPDNMLIVARSRVAVSEFPKGQATEFPPYYKKSFVTKREPGPNEVPILTMGRYGTVLQHYRPSDDAFLAMFDAARHIIRLALQDLGPVCIPKSKITVPGCVWPKEYLSALGRAIWRHGVDVEIVLSNPNSIPNGLSPTDANYGNGWSCVDVAAEIIKTIRSQFPEAKDDDLRKKVAENLRVCFIRRPKGSKWDNDKDTIGLHSKHIIIDDTATYIGSQNLYICDLAEWGIVIDDAATTSKILNSYWKPMWRVSYTGKDVDVQEVMDGLDIDRDGEQASVFAGAGGLTKEQRMALALQTGKGKAHDDEEKEWYLDDENADAEE
jgi:phosphatidylserine/phosphatidylglycerophosphate/cardiolipin synthase-like enzyme